MPLITRQQKGSKLTIPEMDGNLTYLQALSTGQDITYSNLYTKSIAGQLQPGQWYRLTNYKSVNFLNGITTASDNPTPVDPNFNPQEIYEGEQEVLLVKAITEYELSPIGFSETHPGDIITYNQYVNTIGLPFGFFDGDNLPNGDPIVGFDLQWDGTNVYFEMPAGYPVNYGTPLYFSCDFDGGSFQREGLYLSTRPYEIGSNFTGGGTKLLIENGGTKVILSNFTFNDYNDYDQGTLFVFTYYSLGSASGSISYRKDTVLNVEAPFDFRGRKYRRFEVDLTPINSQLGLGYWGIGDDFEGQGTTGNYADFKTFANGDGYIPTTVTWSSGPNLNSPVLGPDNVVFLESINECTLNGTIYDSTIANMYGITMGNSHNNTLGFVFNNIIGDNCYGNFINQFSGSTVGPEFYNNSIGSFTDNQVGREFYGNTAGNGFGNNTISTSFHNNAIGDNFIRNNISLNFSNNTIGDAFQDNTTNGEFTGNAITTSFNNNRIESSFNGNTNIGNGYQYNEILTAVGSTDFGSATHVYSNYNCTIFKNSSGNIRLSYVDGTDTVQYTGINS
jgi:hypothetical protein